VLILVRHGQTPANAQGLFQGRLDPPLSERGRRQAAALAGLLPADARVVTSPLRRARETADAWGRPYEIDEQWVELDYGALDGTPLRDLPEAAWRQWRTDPTFVPAGGESIAALGERVRAACAALADEARTRDVVVVTHVSPVKAAVAWALGVGDEATWRMFVKVASVARLTVDAAGPRLESFNVVPAVADLSADFS